MAETAKTCRGPSCPLCSAKGLALVAVGFLLMLAPDKRLELAGFGLVVAAYALSLSGRI